MTNCIITGIGGQGTVLASKLVAMAAMSKGLSVRTTETIGMAQRGGSVVSHIRMGGSISSPLVPNGMADIIIAFEPAEAVRMINYLSRDGIMIACDRQVTPVAGAYNTFSMTDYLQANIKKLVIINGQKLIAECGAKALNIALLGAGVKSGVFPFGHEDMERIIKDKTPKRFLEMNLAAFKTGQELYMMRG